MVRQGQMGGGGWGVAPARCQRADSDRQHPAGYPPDLCLPYTAANTHAARAGAFGLHLHLAYTAAAERAPRIIMIYTCLLFTLQPTHAAHTHIYTHA